MVKDLLDRERFGGYTSETVDKALLDLPDPLEWSAKEKELYDKQEMISLLMETKEMREAITRANEQTK